MIYCKPVELTTILQITLMLRKFCAGVSEKSHLCGSTHHINVLAVSPRGHPCMFRSIFSDISGTKSGISFHSLWTPHSNLNCAKCLSDLSQGCWSQWCKFQYVRYVIPVPWYYRASKFPCELAYTVTKAKWAMMAKRKTCRNAHNSASKLSNYETN